MAVDDSIREVRLARRRARYAENPEKHREWQTKNPERHAYNSHKYHAKRRGIGFNLTFEEWMTIWTESGKWELRGVRRGCYVMARFGDVGPYAIGNVKIILHEINSVEGLIGVPRTAEVRAKIGAAHKGGIRTPEQRAKISATLRSDVGTVTRLRSYAEAQRGKTQTAEHIAKNRAAQSRPEVLAKKRAVAAIRWADPEERRKASERQLAYLARQRQCPT
jgi:hypothetical protein